jgi:hypothetical protein
MKALVIAGILVVAGVGVLLWYAGMLERPRISEQEMGPYTMMYQSFTGDYKKTKPVFDEVYENLKKEGFSSSTGMGIYYDNPATVPADRLRSDCGAVLEGTALEHRADLAKKYPVKTIERQQCVVAVLPIRSALSYMTGPMKAYPALGRYLQKKGYTVGLAYEIYDMRNKKIFYVMTIATGSR